MRSPLFLLLLGSWGCSTDTFGSDGGSDASTDTSIGDVVIVPDAPPADGTTPGDSSTGDASVPFSCNPVLSGTLLCDDFESSLQVTHKWASCFMNGGGTCNLDLAHWVSPTHAAIFIAPGTSASAAYANLYWQSSTVTSPVLSIQSDIRIHAIDQTTVAPLMRLSYVSPTSNGTINIDVDATGNQLALMVGEQFIDGGVSAQSDALSTYVLDVWHNVRLVVTANMSDVTVAGYVDGSQAVNMTFAVSPPGLGDKYRNVYLGMIESSAVVASVDFDNFRFREVM